MKRWFCFGCLFSFLLVQFFSPAGFGAPAKPKPVEKAAPDLPDPTKTDIDLNSGTVFPAGSLLVLEGYPRMAAVNSFAPAKLEAALGTGTPLFKEYGAVWMHRRQIGPFELSVIRFGHPTLSFGAFCATRLPKAETVHIKHNLCVGKTTASAWVETELLQLQVLKPTPETDLSDELAKHLETLQEKYKTWHTGLPNQDPDQPRIPFVVRHLPLERIDPTTIRFAVGPVGAAVAAAPHGFGEFPFSEGAQLAWAEYVQGSVFSRMAIAEYPTPQSSVEAFQKVEANWKALPPAEQPGRMVKRVGNFVVQTYGVNNPKRAAEIMEAVKYDYVVQWLGPKPYRGPNQNAEIRKTGALLLGIFQMVMASAVFMGIAGIAGGLGYFYWRRQSSRETAFSDAGGMMRLNLNDTFSLPEQPFSPSRQIESGEEK